MAITGDIESSATVSSYPGGDGDSSEGGKSDVYGTSNKKDAYGPSHLDEGKQFDVLKGWWRADAQHSAVWRVEAKEDFDFRAGDQWSAEDRQLLNAQSRPHIVFNRVLTMLKAVAGMEINGRHEVHFVPRGTEDTAVNELLSSASKWMADGCDGEDEESQAFDNALTCGMGWTENRLSYEDDPAGLYVEESIDPLEMYWDRTAKKKNLSDSRRRWRRRKMSLGEAQQMFPGKDRVQLDAVWALGTEMDQAQKTLEEKRNREENTTDSSYDDEYEVTIIEGQWFERETYWIIADPMTNTKMELPDDKYKLLQERAKLIGLNFSAVEMKRKVYKRAFLGGELLKKGETAPLKDRFSWECITGELNRTKGTWFGLVRVMRDPQMWANKWLSQTLHILNTTAKGGIIYEKSAFDDIRQMEESLARPDVGTMAADNAISGNKIMPKPGGTMPAGHIQLMEFAVNALRDVTGINLELLGMKDVNQPGVLEAMRKQAGMTVLATMFDSLRRFRKRVGRIRLFYIQNFFSDGRLIRVVGPEGAKAVPLLKDKTIGEYDVVIDDTPTSPNMKEANWAIIQPLLAVFRDELVQYPQVLAEIMQYSPLPSRLVELIKQLVMQKDQDQEAQQAKQIAIAGAVAKVNKDQSTAEMQNAKAGATEATALYDIAMAKNLLAKNNNSVDSIKELADLRHKTAQTDTERAKAQNIDADTHSKQVGSLVEGMTPIPHEPPQPKAPA